MIKFAQRPAFQRQSIQLLLLIALALLCFGQTLNSYFLADDIWQVSYVWQITTGHWELLWRNFSGNFLDIPSSAIYRPLVVVSMVSDFLLWKTHAAGWFATNLAFYIGNVCLVWLIAFLLSRTGARSQIAFSAAALFAVYPLHCEPVCWLAGRSDLISGFWFEAAFALLLASRPYWNRTTQRLANVLSVLFFWLALLSKEMAVVLPAVIFAYGFAFSSEDGTASVNGKRMFDRLREALALSWIYWLNLLVYFVLRLKFLGTLTGGYTGTLALVSQQSFWPRLMDWRNIYRIFFPFSDSVTGGSLIEPFLCALPYLGLILFIGSCDRKMTSFLWVWVLLACAPILSIWGLGANLEASRIYFFASIPLCIALGNGLANIPKKFFRLALTTVLVLVWGHSSQSVCQKWTEAGEQVRSIVQHAIELCRTTEGKIVVLPLPKQSDGAFLLTNGGMFLGLLQPPYTDRLYAQRFVVFDRLFTEPDAFISSSRFKKALAAPDAKGPYLWRNNSFQLIPMKRSDKQIGVTEIEPSTQVSVVSGSGKKIAAVDNDKVMIDNSHGPQYIEISGLSINPLDQDFLQFDLLSQGRRDAPLFALADWDIPKNDQGQKERAVATGFYREAKSQTVTVPLSHYWRWYVNPQIARIGLRLPTEDKAVITKLRLLPAKSIAPQLSVAARENRSQGFYYVDRSVALIADASAVEGAKACEIQVGKPNFFFDSFTGGDQEQLQAVARIVHSDAAIAHLTISAAELAAPGNYQVRCRALSGNGESLGAWSDAVTLFR